MRRHLRAPANALGPFLLNAATTRETLGLRGKARDLRGLRILVTGASSGIGRAGALALAAEGAHVICVARRREELDELVAEISAGGGSASARPCDLTDRDDVAALATEVAALGGVDVLINNAGRSIRRSIVDSTDRLHDYERTMAINYFAPVQLTLAFIPQMLERGTGHVINVCTWGVAAGRIPRFSAYVASKAAISSFGANLLAELGPAGIAVTAVNYPLVETEMIAPTRKYAQMPALTAEAAAGWLVQAVRHQPRELSPRYVKALQALSLVSPGAVDAVVRRAS